MTRRCRRGAVRGLGALRARTCSPSVRNKRRNVSRPTGNALTCGPRPGTCIAPPSMRGSTIVHPPAHRPMITQRFRLARRAGAAIRGPGQPGNAPVQGAEKPLADKVVHSVVPARRA